MKRLCIYSILLFITITTCNAQWINYNVNNTKGMQASLVNAIVGTSAGYLFFSTDNGIFRYDPALAFWERYQSFSTNVMNSVYASGVTVWAATNGAGAYHTTNGGISWQQFTTSNGLANNIVKDIEEDTNGDYWFATYGGGISRKSGSNWITYNTASGLPTNLYNCVLSASNQTMWFGSSSKGIIVYSDGNWSVINTTNGLLHNMVLQLYEDNSGRIWACGPAGVTVLYQNNVVAVFHSGNGLSGSVAYCAYQNAQDELLIGTDMGVTVISSALQVSDTILNLSDSTVTAIYQNGNDYFFGHDNNGLTYLQNGVVLNIANWDGLGSNYVYNVAQDQSNHYWISNSNGLTEFDGLQWRNYNTNDGFPFNNIRKVLCDSNDVKWVINNNLYRIENGQCTLINVPVKPSGTSIYDIFIDHHNQLWVVFNRSGVACLTDTGWVPYTSGPLTGLYMTCVYVCQNNDVWVGTNNSGLFHLHNGVWTNYNSNNGILHDLINSITEDHQHRIWICCTASSYGGICRYNGTSWTNYTNNEINIYNAKQLLCDSDGNIWVGGNGQNGDLIAALYKNETWHLQIIASYTYSNVNNLFEDHENNIWVCTTYRGVYKAPLLVVSASYINNNTVNGIVFPNPANETATIRTTIKEETDITVEVFDITGRKVDHWFYPGVLPGDAGIAINTSRLSAGWYTFYVRENEKTWTQKMLIKKSE